MIEKNKSKPNKNSNDKNTSFISGKTIQLFLFKLICMKKLHSSDKACEHQSSADDCYFRKKHYPYTSVWV